MLGTLRRAWCPAAMLVSFKLETDEQILLRKVRGGGGSVAARGAGLRSDACLASACMSRPLALHLAAVLLASQCAPSAAALLPCRCLSQAWGAIEAHGVHLVVANELHSRKDRVWLVARGQVGAGRGGGAGRAAVGC